MTRNTGRPEGARSAVITLMRFDHAAIRVPGYDAVVRSYVDMLGLRVTKEWRTGESDSRI